MDFGGRMYKPKIKRRKLARQEDNRTRQKISRQKRKHGSEYLTRLCKSVFGKMFTKNVMYFPEINEHQSIDKLIVLSQELGGYDIVEKENNE